MKHHTLAALIGLTTLAALPSPAGAQEYGFSMAAPEVRFLAVASEVVHRDECRIISLQLEHPAELDAGSSATLMVHGAMEGNCGEVALEIWASGSEEPQLQWLQLGESEGLSFGTSFVLEAPEPGGLQMQTVLWTASGLVAEVNSFAEVGERLDTPAGDEQVCCQLDDGMVPFLTSAQSCDRVVPRELCDAPPAETPCCCAADDGPGTEGQFALRSQCSAAVCLPGIPSKTRSEPGACVIDKRVAVTMIPDWWDQSRASRLAGLGKKSSGLGTMTSSLCVADPNKPNEPCYDHLLCGLSSTGNVICRAYHNGKYLDVPPAKTPAKPGKPAGSRYRNTNSRYLSHHNRTDASARNFYNLSGGSADVWARLHELWFALQGNDPKVANRLNYTDEMLNLELAIQMLKSQGLYPGPSQIVTVDIDGKPTKILVDGDKLELAEAMDSELVIFQGATNQVKNATARTAIARFLARARDYVGNFLISCHHINPPQYNGPEQCSTKNLHLRKADLRKLTDELNQIHRILAP